MTSRPAPMSDWTRPVAVFSHPNHELAIFGLLQRLRPALVFLTDGGGAARVEETRAALATSGLLEQATFLDYPESRFYERLLARDHEFWADVAARVRAVLATRRPSHLLCDAVELYNPVHDVSLPIVRAACRDAASGVPVFEVPLVYQVPGSRERYVFQRFPPTPPRATVTLDLTDAEFDAKLHARDAVYRCLAGQMGELLQALPRAHVRREVVGEAPATLPATDDGRVLRYEWRARRLLSEGAIAETIGWATHYRPVAERLW